MNLNVYLEDELIQKLAVVTKKKGLSRNMIIRLALSEWLKKEEKSQWPKDFFKFDHDKKFPLDTELRKNLKSPNKDPLK